MSGFYPSRAMPPRLSSFRTSPPYTPFIGPASRNASYGFPAGRNETGNALNPVIPSTSILRRETSFVSEQEISPLSLDYRNDDPGLTKVDSMRIAVEQVILSLSTFASPLDLTVFSRYVSCRERKSITRRLNH